MIKRGYFLEYSQSTLFSIGTSLDVVETIHELDRICLRIVNYDGLKMLKSKHFPAKYVLLPPPKVEAVESTPQEQTTTPPSTNIEETKSEQHSDQYDLELKDETTIIENLQAQFISWFPELASS